MPTADKEPRFIPYIPPPAGQAARPPLQVPLVMQRWTGSEWAPVWAGGMTESQLRAEPQWPKYRVGPGETVEILLSDWQAEGDGIYTYRLNIYMDLRRPGADLSFLGQAHCDPFVIDGAKARTRAGTTRSSVIEE